MMTLYLWLRELLVMKIEVDLCLAMLRELKTWETKVLEE